MAANMQVAYSNQSLWADAAYKYHEIFTHEKVNQRYLWDYETFILPFRIPLKM
jgi:hypothetical protein